MGNEFEPESQGQLQRSFQFLEMTPLFSEKELNPEGTYQEQSDIPSVVFATQSIDEVSKLGSPFAAVVIQLPMLRTDVLVWAQSR